MTTNLREILEICHEYGVTDYETPQLKLKISLKARTASTQTDLPDEDDAAKLPEIMGKDGLTAQEQIDLYGVVLDAKR